MDFPSIPLSLTSIIVSIVAGFVSGYSFMLARRARQRSAWAHEQAEAAFEILELMEQAHDPGRDIQNRLAACLEAKMVDFSDGPIQREEGRRVARRLAAQTMASQIIMDIERADLVLAKREEPS